MMKIEDIKKLIELGEGYHLELKKSLDKTFIEEVCAFINSSGGKIILGVTDKGVIEGIKTDNTIRSKIQDTLKQIEPSIDIKISVIENLIVVEVPQGIEKPYGCSRGFFVRIGPNSQKLTRNEIVSFFEKEGRIRFDELENRKADFDSDFDEKAFSSFLKLSGISPTIDRKYLLKNLDCLKEGNKLTNGGVLFFTKSTEFLIMQATVVCVLYKCNEKLHILDKKDFDTNIIENIENAILFVNRHTNLAYKIEHIRREEIPDIPEIALRETIINAVCHRNYFQKGANVMIEVFDNRVEISNPGGLPSDLKPEEFGTKSVVRNPVIASLLHRADYIEKIGTGISRIKNAVRDHRHSTVEFIFTEFFTVRFSRGKISVEDSTAKGDLIVDGTLSGGLNGTLNGGLSRVLKNLYDYVLTHPGIKINELSESLNRPVDTLDKQIRNLIGKDFIVRRSSKKTGGYWVTGTDSELDGTLSGGLNGTLSGGLNGTL
ncbi:MAG: putative DNA binding domain-containing protein, partial [Spirochaetaceae bacterium]|nr:putative DNA binding domain-containing protein [Spirochaetaceae bacterium]